MTVHSRLATPKLWALWILLIAVLSNFPGSVSASPDPVNAQAGPGLEEVEDSPPGDFAQAKRGVFYDAAKKTCPPEPSKSPWVDRYGCPILPTPGQPKSMLCGGFAVDFADVENATRQGFDDPDLGPIRRETVCQVLSDLADVIDIGRPLSMGSNPDILVTEAKNEGGKTLGSATPSFSRFGPGCSAGALHEHILTGVDPTPGVGEYDAHIQDIDFGERTVLGRTVQVNSDWRIQPTTDFDLYSIILHEVTHALGFISLIGPDGESVQNDLLGFFDAFLTDEMGDPLIDSACSDLQGELEDLTSNSVLYGTSMSRVSQSLPIYSPVDFRPGSSLSHLDGLRDGTRYVMRPSTLGGTDREYRGAELDILCDLGYTVFGNICNNRAPVGVDDHDLTTQTTEPGRELCIDVLANDFDPDGDPLSLDPESIQILSGGGGWTIREDALCYTPSTGFTGTAWITYQPSDGQRLGNVTRVLVHVESDVCPDDACNLVCNGSFENGVPDNAPLDVESLRDCPSKVDGWCSSDPVLHSTPDLFIRGTSYLTFGIPSNFATVSSDVDWVDTPTGVGNDRYVGFIQQYVGNYGEGIYTQLPSKLVAGRAYDLEVYAFAIRTFGTSPGPEGNLEIFLDTVRPDRGVPSPTAQRLYDMDVPLNAQWNPIRRSFTAENDDLQYLAIQTKLPLPEMLYSVYVFVDDVSLHEATDVFEIDKTVSDPTPQIGDTITYSIEVCHQNPVTVFDVTIEDLLPFGLTYVGGFNQYPRHTFPSIPGNSCETLELVATVHQDVQLNTPIRNCVGLVSEGNACGGQSANTPCTELVVAGTDLAIEKSVHGVEAEPGDEVVFTIEVTNLGPGDASNIVVLDRLPLGLSFEGFLAATASYDRRRGHILIPSLPAGTSESVAMLATVGESACRSTLTNTATLSGFDGTDLDTTNNQSSASLNILPCEPGTCRGYFSDSGQRLGLFDSVDVALGDLDGDGDLDAVVANHTDPATLWRNDGTGQFSVYQGLPTDADVAVELGDLDGDGDLDLFVSDGVGAATVWRNDGAGLFSQILQKLLGPAKTLDAALGDFDGDGDLDAVEANDGGNQLWTNDGTGVFSPAQVFDNGSSWGIALGDVDGNGWIDAFVANDGGDQLWHNFNGTLSQSGQILGQLAGRDVALGDIDQDGDLDAVICHSSGGANQVWRRGGGTFVNSDQALDTGANALALGDLDCDGSLDAFLAHDGRNRVWQNDGSGLFSRVQTMGNSDTHGVALGDLDGDGDLDALTVNRSGQANRVWMND